MIKFVSDLRQVSGFLRVLRFPPPIKLTAEILLQMALNTINQTSIHFNTYFTVHSVEDRFGEALYDFEGENDKELSFKVCIINSN